MRDLQRAPLASLTRFKQDGVLESRGGGDDIRLSSATSVLATQAFAPPLLLRSGMLLRMKDFDIEVLERQCDMPHLEAHARSET